MVRNIGIFSLHLSLPNFRLHPDLPVEKVHNGRRLVLCVELFQTTGDGLLERVTKPDRPNDQQRENDGRKTSEKREGPFDRLRLIN